MPLGYSIFSGAVLYDAWRHTFFVYPALLIMALVGLVFVAKYLAGRFTGRAYTIGVAGLVCLVGWGVISSAGFMVRYHPHQNVYFNSLVGGPGGAVNRFEMDYWGLSYRHLLEYIVANDTAARIPVRAAHAPGRFNADILPARDRKRLVYVSDDSGAKYYITNFRWERGLPPGSEWHTLTVAGAKIAAVYRLR
jgi:hypothetical protein